MAGRTKPRVGARFFRMTRREAGPMQPRKAYFVERELGGKRWHRALAVARRALPFRVAARAKVALARCTDSVLAYPIAVVHQMVLRHGAVVPKVDVASIAVAELPLVAVLVAAEARRHLGKDCIGPRFGDLDVAPNAVSIRCDHVPTVIKPKPRSRVFHGATHV